jgi:hypothetical protein
METLDEKLIFLKFFRGKTSKKSTFLFFLVEKDAGSSCPGGYGGTSFAVADGGHLLLISGLT